MGLYGRKGDSSNGPVACKKGDTHIGLQTKRTDNAQQLRAILYCLQDATRYGRYQFRLSSVQYALHTMRGTCLILIVFIQLSYQGDFFRISVVYRYFFDLSLLIYQSNAAVISKGRHNQLRDLL